MKGHPRPQVQAYPTIKLGVSLKPCFLLLVSSLSFAEASLPLPFWGLWGFWLQGLKFREQEQHDHLGGCYALSHRGQAHTSWMWGFSHRLAGCRGNQPFSALSLFPPCGYGALSRSPNSPHCFPWLALTGCGMPLLLWQEPTLAGRSNREQDERPTLIPGNITLSFVGQTWKS